MKSCLFIFLIVMAEAEEFDVENIIGKLLKVRGSREREHVELSKSEILGLSSMSGEIFLTEPTLLELEAPLIVCGSLHGQFYDLLRLFEYSGFPPAARYLFLGDYVDGGEYSLETISLLLAYKIKYPQNFFLLRGQHESRSVGKTSGFKELCKRKYNIKVWRTFIDCFNSLPIAAIINEKIFCVHGGLSPDLQSMDQLKRLMRPTDVPDEGLLHDLLYSNPEKDIDGWGNNGNLTTFGSDIVTQFLANYNFDLICRAHQVVEDGYEFFAKRELVTLFSAPNYNGLQNAGAMMSIAEDLTCSFLILRPVDDLIP